MKYRDLPDPNPSTTLPGGAILLAKQPLLYCPQCGDTASANRGDYWAALDEEAVCPNCAEDMEGTGNPEPLVLAYEETVTVPADRLGEFARMVAGFFNG